VYNSHVFSGGDMTVYIYILVDSRDSRIFYVGQTRDLRRRLYPHLSKRRFPGAKNERIREIVDSGGKVLLIEIEETTEELCLHRELYWWNTLVEAGANILVAAPKLPSLKKVIRNGWDISLAAPPYPNTCVEWRE
jgi:hypothetical protein